MSDIVDHYNNRIISKLYCNYRNHIAISKTKTNHYKKKTLKNLATSKWKVLYSLKKDKNIVSKGVEDYWSVVVA